MAKMIEPDNDDIEFVDDQKDCEACGGSGSCTTCDGHDDECEECDGTGDCQECDGSGTES